MLFDRQNKRRWKPGCSALASRKRPLSEDARKGSLKIPKRKPRPVTVSKPQKGRSKLEGGIPLDELLAAHVAGRPARATEKTLARARAAAKSAKAKQKASGRRLPRRDDAQVGQDGPPRLVGYARISTDDQTTALQADALTRAAVEIVFEEEASGANIARPILARTLAALQSGDTLVVWRLDRLGRSLSHLIEIATMLRERRIFLRSLTEGFDTSTASGRLLYHVLGAVAEFEREVIKERTVAGMKAAKKRGTHVGRPKALAGSRLAEAGRMLAAGKSQIETARILRVSRATIQRAYPSGIGTR